MADKSMRFASWLARLARRGNRLQCSKSHKKYQQNPVTVGRRLLFQARATGRIQLPLTFCIKSADVADFRRFAVQRR
jgi:hypothetical protein